MQFLGNAMEYVLEARDQRLNILGATSGDTGSAAEYAMRALPRIAYSAAERASTSTCSRRMAA